MSTDASHIQWSVRKHTTKVQHSYIVTAHNPSSRSSITCAFDANELNARQDSWATQLIELTRMQTVLLMHSRPRPRDGYHNPELPR